jgi:hypothetical protein
MTVSNQAQVAYSYDSANRRTSLSLPMLPSRLEVWFYLSRLSSFTGKRYKMQVSESVDAFEALGHDEKAPRSQTEHGAPSKQPRKLRAAMVSWATSVCGKRRKSCGPPAPSCRSLFYLSRLSSFRGERYKVQVAESIDALQVSRHNEKAPRSNTEHGAPAKHTPARRGEMVSCPANVSRKGARIVWATRRVGRGWRIDARYIRWPSKRGVCLFAGQHCTRRGECDSRMQNGRQRIRSRRRNYARL